MTKKHEYVGIVESRNLYTEVDKKSSLVTRWFLLQVDVSSNKVAATYGPFKTIMELLECASLHSIKLKLTEV
jgi:hypothetical protein